MNPINLAARYSLMPNKLKFSSEEDVDKVLLNHVKTNSNRNVVKKILERSNALHLYLNLIAKHNNKDVYDKEVIEAYWLGNKLLEKVPSSEIKSLILKEFTGMPKSAAIELANNVPEDALPHHSFHVFHIHSVTKKVGSLTNIDKCRISWGKVRHIGKDKLIVAYIPIESKGKIRFGSPKEIEVSYHKEFIPNVKEGDYVSMHWDMAIQVLNSEQVENLKKYTERNIKAINSL